uniref:GP5a n=1 Tax=Porcine reproductive and respiratory syndrome virus TaxID=28344 RepID=A0A6B9I400_PRRSV|nr:ORF5a protein [Porcine reproductive and respiratory syndrome virus]WOZ07392.1 GP5a protein [Porcine reproductive and respiratory syndrome virus 2]QGY98843.1 ORF5a protein [Porcine reproductive and respiratory syndrome virus]QGY98853.1 ORF5a protein [Porcine reproductive and respiratory syndrome virus]QGY98863.1 ORF5a protein [Porcine reproductive and respiratory syndrome virus]
MFKYVGEMLDRGLLLAIAFFVVYRAILFCCARQRQQQQQLSSSVNLQLDAM